MDPQRATQMDDAGKLVLRLVLAIMLLFHGFAKLSGGIESVYNALSAHGLPLFFAYGVFVGEIIAPILILFGFFTRPAAIVVIINMIVALLLSHTKQLLTINPANGSYALELQMFYLFGALAIALLGAGRYSLGRRFN